MNGTFIVSLRNGISVSHNIYNTQMKRIDRIIIHESDVSVKSGRELGSL